MSPKPVLECETREVPAVGPRKLIVSSATEVRTVEIRRITDQNGSLDESYAMFAALGPDNVLARIGARMLELVRHLREVKGPSVWAVTSHAALNLKAGDDYRLPTLVSVDYGGEWFHIRYSKPSGEAPWPGAYVTGQALDVQRASEMIVFGLHEALKATGSQSQC